MVNFESGVRSSRLAFALAALSTAAAVHAQPLRLYVDDDAPAGGDGRLWATAFKSVAEAIVAAESRQDRRTLVEIRVAEGHYVNLATPGGETVVGSGVSLLGGFAGVLNANPNERSVSRFVSVLSGDRMRNDDWTAASRSDNARVTVIMNQGSRRLSGFEVRSGQVAIYVRSLESVPIDDCVITDNALVESLPEPFIKAIFVANNALISNCQIVDNASAFGVLFSSGVVKRSIIAGNTTSGSGSTINLIWQATLFQSLVAANVSASQPTIQGGRLLSCTIADNRAPLGPAAAFPSRLANCIIFRNVSTSQSPSHQVLLFSGQSLLPTRTHFDNALSDIRVEGSFNAVAADVARSGDPLFVRPSGLDGSPLTWRDNDYRLRAGSRCIDSAAMDDVLYLDQLVDLDDRSPFDDPATVNSGFGYTTYADLGAFEYLGRMDCPSDFDLSGELSSRDVIDFLNAWFARDPRTDWDATGTLTAADIVAFLNDWFAGC